MDPKTAAKIDEDLGFLLDDAEVLAETLPEWDEISEAERSIWQFEWPNDLGILDRLDRSRGSMTDGQHVRYWELLGRLREIAPALEETGLGRPGVIDRTP